MDFSCIFQKRADPYTANLTKTVLFWIVGLVAGMCFYKLNSPVSKSFFYCLWSGNYSFSSIFLVGLFPAVISVVSLYTLPLGFFWATVSVTAFLHSYVGCSLVCISENSPLLYWVSLQFPCVVSLPILWYSWLIILKKQPVRTVYKQFLLLVISIILCYAVQNTVVLPFFRSVIIF